MMQIVHGHSPYRELVKRYSTEVHNYSLSSVLCDCQTRILISVRTCQHLNGIATFSCYYSFEDDPIVAVGKGEPAVVMAEYGFR
jgi:hypothetical protein